MQDSLIQNFGSAHPKRASNSKVANGCLAASRKFAAGHEKRQEESAVIHGTTCVISTDPLFRCTQNFKILQYFLLHRIFERMYEVLNVAKQNN